MRNKKIFLKRMLLIAAITILVLVVSNICITEIYAKKNSTNIMVSLIPGAGEYFDKLLWHELFHCLTRCNPEFREQMYALIHFTVADADYELPPCVQDYCISRHRTSMMCLELIQVM